MDGFEWVTIAFIVFILAVGAFGITMSVQASTRFHDECIAHGGHTKSVGGRGGAICISPDGRILEW